MYVCIHCVRSSYDGIPEHNVYQCTVHVYFNCDEEYMYLLILYMYRIAGTFEGEKFRESVKI